MTESLYRKKRTALIALFLFCSGLISATAQEGYQFEEIKRLPATSVKNQGETGTCWTFSTISMLESELMRKGKGDYDLSEMFIVRQSYLDRAKLFVRFHGNLNFGPGAQAWDVMNVLDEYGIVPQNVFPGLKAEKEYHSHSEMDRVLKGYMESVIRNENEKLTTIWDEGFRGILSAYLGNYPQSFNVDGETYTPASFLDELDIEPNNYIPMTSFKNHSYFSSYVFESPDNWSMESVYNVPLETFVDVIDAAIMNDYTVAWAADVTDPGFKHSKGIAIVPEKDWDKMEESEEEEVFKKPVKQKEITEEKRLKAFNNQTTTDDHLMHIVGKAKDQKGTDYYIVKNSWGKENPYNGYLYVSEAYVKYKTTSIMLNKNALNRDLREKLAL